MATQKLDKDSKKILDNMKKALPKLTKLQKENLVKGTEFLASFTEYSDSSSNPSAVTQKGGGCMEQRFYGNADIQRIYGISRATAFTKMKEIRKAFNIDEKRLPKKGRLPAKLVERYFDQTKSI